MAERVGVLFGGQSTEHKISCLSAYNIAQGLQDAGYEVALAGITLEGDWLTFDLPLAVLHADDWAEQTRQALAGRESRRFEPQAGFSPKETLYTLFDGPVDVIWPAVHGINCEDGILQGFLEMTGIPYVGSRVLASSVGMDKIISKMFCEYAGIPVTPWLSAARTQIEEAADLVRTGQAAPLLEEIASELGFPCFLKPANGGSSVGTFVVRNDSELLEQLLACSEYDRVVLCETFVNARELEVAVSGNETLTIAPVGEIVKSADIQYYDYKAKYFSADGSTLAIPADVDPDIAAQLRAYAGEIYQLIGCEGMARVDFFVDKDSGSIYFNEINTLPGFTSISLYPVAMGQALGSSSALMTRMIELSLDKKRLHRREEAVSI